MSTGTFNPILIANDVVNTFWPAGKLNSLYNDGTLQAALGNNAHALLDHAGASQSKLASIADAIASQNSKKRAVAYVGKRAAAGAASIAVGGAAAAEGAKLLGVLGGK